MCPKVPHKRDLRNSKRGSMPFALIAVTLLLTSSAFGVIYANIQRTGESTENIGEEMMSIDEAIYESKSIIEAELGTIICELSTAETGGTLMERVREFDRLAEASLNGRFPHSNRGIVTEIVDYDLALDVESMKLSSGDILADAPIASYLVASGTVTMSYTGTMGSSVRTLDISANGTSGLPFIVENASRFELDSSGDSSLLAQLVSYQLSSLAQYRIVNGYGLRSYYGERGTENIITEDDVNNAFRNALSAIEKMCFRCSVDGLDGKERVDLGEMAVLKDGRYVIDISAILSQALLSIIDMIVFRWVDLTQSDEVLNFIDSINDFGKEVANNVINWLFHGNSDDTNRNSAYIYLKEEMESKGYGQDFYRYIMSGRNFRAEIPEGTLLANGTEFGYSGGTYNVDYPVVDVFAWGGWNNFVTDYNRDTNNIMEYMKSTLVTICNRIVEQGCVMTVQADMFDEVAFTTSFVDSVNSCLIKCLDEFSSEMESQISKDKMIEPVYASMYKAMRDHRDAIFGEDTYGDRVADALAEKLMDGISGDASLARYALRQSAVEKVREECDIESICQTYEQQVDRVLEAYESALMKAQKNTLNIVKESLILGGKLVMKLDVVRDSVTAIAVAMMIEIKNCVNINCSYGLVNISGSDRYRFYDDDGNIYEEFADVSDSYTIDIDVIDPSKNGDKSYHKVGADEIDFIAYTSVFTVNIRARVNYTAHTMTEVDRALGRYDSSFRGQFDVDTSLDIACVSGWSLTGVDYRPDSNIATEALKFILSIIKPMLGELSGLYNELKVIYNILNAATFEIRSTATKIIEELYEELLVPVDFLADWCGSNASFALKMMFKYSSGFDVGPAYQKFVFDYLGLKITVEFNLVSLIKTTKSIVKVTCEGKIGNTAFSIFVDYKEHDKKGSIITFGGGVSTDDWAFDLKIDPLMKGGNKTLSVDGRIRDVEFSVAIPERSLYDEFNASLAQIPAVGQAMSNIPLPVPGLKCAFDMGIDIKYNLPTATGLLINEFESNPAGSDNGTEWVELYNCTSNTINLSGYMLVPQSNEAKAIVITGESIAPFEKKVIYFEKQSLNNGKSKGHSGESIVLYSPDGDIVDKTPWKQDTLNNSKSWQREYDGSANWAFNESTPGSSNGPIIRTSAIEKTFLIDTFLRAVDKSFTKMGNHLTSMEDIEAFLESVLREFINEVIEKIANMIVSATVYILVEITDYTQSGHTGLKVGFQMNADLVKQSIYWILDQIDCLADLVKGPECNDPVNLVCQNVYLTTTVYASVSTPKILAGIGEEMVAGFNVSVNVSGLFGMFGQDKGKWRASGGVVLEGIDPKLLPAGIKSNAEKLCDLWLIKVSFAPVDG